MHVSPLLALVAVLIFADVVTTAYALVQRLPGLYEANPLGLLQRFMGWVGVVPALVISHALPLAALALPQSDLSLKAMAAAYGALLLWNVRKIVTHARDSAASRVMLVLLAFVAVAAAAAFYAPPARAADRIIGGSTTMMVGKVNAQGAQDGIVSVARLPSAAATTNATSVKAAAGTVYSIDAHTVASSVRCLKLYDKATVPAVGTDVPKMTFAMPPGGRFTAQWSAGIVFATGIAYAITVNCTDADATALAAGDVLGLNIGYQ